MDFKQEINELEKYLTENNFEIKTGNVPILFSAPHTMIQIHHDGTVKLSEPYTKAISLYLNKYDKTYSIVKLADTGMDSNRDNNDEYKKALINLVKENGIKFIKHNDPFKGGTITQYLYNLEDVDAIQIEINGRYRDCNNVEFLKKIIESLENFIRQYDKYINR